MNDTMIYINCNVGEKYEEEKKEIKNKDVKIMSDKVSLSSSEGLEKVAKKLEESKVFGKLASRFGKKKPDGSQLVLNVINLSPEDRKKVQDTIAHLEKDIKEAEAGIERDRQSIKKLKALV